MKNAIKSIFNGPVASGTLTHEIAYLLFRFYCGFTIAYGAGFSKVFHKIDENGTDAWDNLAFGVPQWFVDQVGEIGFTFISPSFWAHLAVYGEFIGGLLVALGLFTRISAIQLAFQFFVVSFIWYDEPMPFAMYYQQLIFWGFVLIAAVGGGRFSLDNWLVNRQLRSSFTTKSIVVAGCLVLLPMVGFSQEQAEVKRVSFSLGNPSLKAKDLEVRYFDPTTKKSAGYGFHLGPLQHHADNKPVGTRVYLKKWDGYKLAFVLTHEDDGRTFDIGKTYGISREQWLQAAQDEEGERVAALEDANAADDLEVFAKQNGLSMVTFVVAGKLPLKRQVHVRAQLPLVNEKTSHGFSRKLSTFSRFEVSYPVGTKIYLCDGPYWNGDVKETLLLIVDTEKQNYLMRI